MKAFKLYKQVFLTSVQRSLEYRTNAILTLISCIFPIVMQYFLMTKIYAQSTSSELYGLTYNKMIVYILFAPIISIVIGTGFEYEIAEDIKNGAFNTYVVKPINFFKYKMSQFLGGKAIVIGTVSIISVAIISIAHFIYNTDFKAVNILFFIITILLSLIINFMLFYMISAVSFWVAEVWGIIAGLNVLIRLFSGGLFPIEVFGTTIVSILKFFPFQYTIYFSIKVLLGAYTIGEILKGLCIQLLWIVILYLLEKLVWCRGLKQYVSIGG